MNRLQTSLAKALEYSIAAGVMERPPSFRAWLHFFPEYEPARPWVVERPNGSVLTRATHRWAWCFVDEHRAIDFARRAGWDLVLVDFCGPVPSTAAFDHPVSP